MGSVHAFLRQALWLAVCIVPLPAGAFAVQTADMLLVSLLLFTALETAAPFLYFGAQRTGYGAAEGKDRCGVHLASALSVCAVLWLSVWAAAAGGASLETGLGAAASAVLSAAGYFLLHLLVLLMDRVVMGAYRALRKKSDALRQWLALSFFIGWIPGVLLSAGIFLALVLRGNPLFSILLYSVGLTWVFYVKIVLAMMSFAFYLYFTLKGTWLLRCVQVAFTAVLWLLLIYAPLVLSLQIPGGGAWRVWADPSYLSIFPFLSDLWTVGLASWGGRKITAWAIRAAD